MILGSFDSGVIVFAPAGEMLNLIVSAPGLTFASEIAFLREPLPVSLIVVTTKTDPMLV
jgi:hypothetical protein